MHERKMNWMCGKLATFLILAPVLSRASSTALLPDIRQLMQQVQDHQKQLEDLREAYTYSSLHTTQDLDATGKVTKTETEEKEDFFVNGHIVRRTVKRNGRSLSEQEQQKETEHVTKAVGKAQESPPGEHHGDQTIRVSRVLELMDVRNPRRENFRGRSTIVFDFVGRKDAKTHGLAEDASKKLKGTIWIDEADLQVAHLDVIFDDNFHVGGGLIANVQKGSNFHFDQAAVDGGLWLPTGGEGTVEARVLLLKNMRQHFTERMYDYKRFRVDTQSKDATVIPTEKH